MLRAIVEVTGNVLRLGQELKQNREEIKEIRKELRDAVAATERLALAMERLEERERHAREKLVLQIQNVMLRERPVLALAEPVRGADE